MSQEQAENIDAAINTAANLPAAVAALLAVSAFLVYVVGSRGAYKRSLLGITFAGLIFAVLPLFAVVFGRRLFGEYAGYGWVALGVYTTVAMLYAALLFAIVVEQRRGNAEVRPPMKENENV